MAPKVRKLVDGLKAAVSDSDLRFHLFWSRVLDEIWARAWTTRFAKAPGPQTTRQKGFRVFSYHRGDHVDEVLERLRCEYACLAAGAYDYAALSRTLGVSEDELFVILLRETAYELFQDLDATGVMPFPAVLRNGSDAPTFRALVSLELVGPPRAEDKAIALSMRSPGRRNGEAVAEFRKVLQADPDNQGAWFHYGLWLYDMGQYRDALEVFRKLSLVANKARDEDEQRMRDWSHVWMGHMYDLLGERDEALAEYRTVL
jgi:tetratricopeptide (TPR) repeat protein